jgi:hypothetical protein
MKAIGLYQGDGYKLDLNYTTNLNTHGDPILSGKFTIENKNLKSNYDIVGSSCNL